jgi:hypothetical protein
MSAKIFRLIIILPMFVFGVSFPAQGQLYPYPVIIVPPPAQNLVVPKPKPVVPRAQPAPASPPPDAPASGQIQCHFQGQTRVCN